MAASRRTSNLSFLARIVLGRTSLKRRLFSSAARRSASFAKAIILGRVVRRLLAKPAATNVSVRTRRAVIDVESR